MALGKMIIMVVMLMVGVMAVSGCETPTGPSSNDQGSGRRVVKPVPTKLGE